METKGREELKKTNFKRTYKEFETYYFDCLCYSNEHTVRFVLDPNAKEDGNYEDRLWLETYLHNYHRWYKRLWIAIKYVFGYRCMYGHFDCTIIKPSQYKKLRELIEHAERLDNECENS
jgi:hypothetical protein